MRKLVVETLSFALALLTWQALCIADVHAQDSGSWLQWGRTAQHNADSPAVGQNPQAQLADITYDPFVAQEQAEEGGPLTAHYQVPLIDGDTTFLEYKTGVYTPCNPPGSHVPYPCGPDAWNQEIWNERAFTWQNGALVQKWNFQTDWKPEPNSNFNDIGVNMGFTLFGWEPVFHAALSNGYVFVPGASGSIYKLNEADGSIAAHIAPFGSDPNVYVSGPLTADVNGNIYYNAMRLDPVLPWSRNAAGAWLVKIAPNGGIRSANYQTLVPNQQVNCFGPCGSQRPAINVAPAISPDGKTLYTVSRAHFDEFLAYMVAVNVSDLSPKWQLKLAGFLGSNNIDFVSDFASSTPAVAPDGSIFFGVLNLGTTTGRGELLKFSPGGQYLAAFNFGWDETPAIYPHDGTYSLIIKNNYYFTAGPYYITQLDSNLIPEWHFKNETVDPTHPNGYEWCINAPAVDANGVVYANSEDGNIYVITQGGTLKGKIFLRLSLEAAYTPLAIGPDGRLYTENDGDMIVVGEK